MFIFQIDPGKILGAENKKDVSKPIENPDSVLLNSMSRTHPIIQPPGVPVPPNNQIPPAMLFGKIVDLANEYIIYAHTHPYSRAIPPWERSNELFDTLAQYTGTHVNNESVKAIKDFFYNIQTKNSDDPNKDGKLDHNDVLALWKGDKCSSLLKEIDSLYNDIFVNPKHYAERIAKVARTLAKYTHTEYTVGKADSLRNFNWANDITGDGVLDYKDLIAYWKNLDNSTPRFPALVDIDFNHDGKFDYAMRDGKLYKVGEDGRTLSEAKGIPGVDLHELADMVEKKFKESNYSTKVDFDIDINHDGIKDRIYSWDVISSMEKNPPVRPMDLNNSRPQKLKGDLNGDGKVDQTDVQCLYSFFPEANMNQDSKLDQEDYNILKKSIEEGRPVVIHIGGPMGPDHILGDVNGDNKIDEKDLDLLKNMLNVGDLNNDKKVDDKDLELLKELANKVFRG